LLLYYVFLSNFHIASKLDNVSKLLLLFLYYLM
jgi:hypothetical protein